MTPCQYEMMANGEAVMQVMPETFCNMAHWTLEMVKDQEGKDHLVRLVPAPFWAMQYVNDGQHLPGDVAPEPERVQQSQKRNIQLYQSPSPGTA